jgi:hypothetical protein
MLAKIDATLSVFEPGADPSAICNIMPVKRCIHFRHDEQRQLCLGALREAKGPATARHVAEYAMHAKGMDVEDAALRTVFVEQVRVALARSAAQGWFGRCSWRRMLMGLGSGGATKGVAVGAPHGPH